ncbi:hypothetical protein FA15DRAFT_546184, partial [Coprinopsis marcescibilis]
RSCADHRKAAEEYLNACDSMARKVALDKHGVRWSEFLCLPYWDPSTFLVVDTMHNLFLGNIKRHCRNVDIWAM